MTSRRQLALALGPWQRSMMRAMTCVVAGSILGSGTVLAGPQAASNVLNAEERVYLKQDGGNWFEVRKAPAGLEKRAAAAPRAATAAGLGAVTSAAGSGLFEPYTAIQTGSWPEAVAIGDVTGDGRNDVAMVTSFYFDDANDYKLFIFAQRPDGTLDIPVKYDAAGTYTSSPETVAIGDVNGDGRNDVVVGNAGDAIGVFYQNASGTLDPIALHPTTDSKCVRIADLNHDGRLDIVGAGWGTDTVTVLLQQADGTLAAPVVYSAPHDGWDDLDVGDLNGDGWADIAVMSGQGSAPNVSVLYQQANGTLGGLVSRFVPNVVETLSIGVGDVSGDARSDLVSSFWGQPSDGLAVFKQDISGALPATPMTYSDCGGADALDVADVTGEGRADVLAAYSTELAICPQAGGVLGSAILEPMPYATHFNPHGLAVGDIDSDGKPDVVVANYNYGLVIIRHAHPPTITGFSPTSGGRFATVQVTGTSFTGATDVRFNGTSATFSVVTPTVITTTVPAAASTGPISVTTPGGTATSASSFTVTSTPAPTITSFSPTAGVAGTPVTITGTNFTGVTAVAFAGVSATFTVDSATQISTTVPAAARSGSITVTGPGGTAVSTMFTVPTAFAVGKIAEIASGSVYFGADFPGSGATGFTTYQGYVYFFASENWDSLHTADRTGLWRTDGTTVEFREPFRDIAEMAVLNGKLLISGTYEPGTPYGRELWSYNGTSLTLVKDIYTGSVSSSPSRFFVVPAGVVAPEERLLFSASPDQNGPTLQVTDGTTAGTAVLDTFKDPREFVTFNGSVFLTAKETQASTETNLWSWSPSTGRQLIEARVDGQLAAVASTLFIAKRSGTSTGRLKQELWTTNGLQDAATPLSNLWPNGDAAVSELTTVGTTVFFAACDPKVGRGLYKTDGTTVTPVKDFVTPGSGFAAGPSNSCDPANGPNQLTVIHGRLYFVVDDGVHGLELWTSDGTADGTRMVQDLNQDPSAPLEFKPAEPSDPSLNLASCGRSKCRVETSNGFFFTAQTVATGRELWYCDETTMTIAMAADPLPGPLSGVTSGYLARLGSRIVFAGADGYANSEPWTLDIGPAGLAARSAAAAPRDDRAPTASVAASRSTDGLARRGVAGGHGPGRVVNAVPTLSIAGVVPPIQNPPVCIEMAGTVCVREGAAVTFKVTLDSGIGGHSGDIYVDYRTVPISDPPEPIPPSPWSPAKPGTDYVEKISFAPDVHTLEHTPLKFAATTSSTPQVVTFSVATVNDQTYEDHYKSFAVEIFNPTEGTIGIARAAAWIENEDAPGPDGPYWPTVSLNSVGVTESATNPPFAVFTATLDKPSEYTTRLYWTSGVGGEDPPADPALDYRETSGFFVFRPGETSHTVTIETFDDTIDEPNEKFWVDLDTESNWGAWVGVGRGVGVITDNDNSTMAIADAGSIPEGDSGTTSATFHITISAPYYRDFTLAYTTVDGAAKAGLDYTPIQGTLFFPKGATERSLTVPVLGDVLDENNESFTLALSASTGPSFADASGTATIVDDDTTVSIADASVTEGNTGTATITFTVSTADAAGNKAPFTIDYATAAGGTDPATPGVDYVETSGQLSFPAGVKSKTFTVTVNSDLIDEPAEHFLVHLSNSTGPVIFDADATGTINDNDTASVTVNSVTVTEGNSGTTNAVFTVSINTPYYRDFTVDWATGPPLTGTAAAEGVDYLGGSGQLTFPAGTTSRTVTVSVVGDTLDEPNEIFSVLLSNVVNGPAITGGRGNGTITDDDALTISVEDVKVVEGNSGTTLATFTLTVPDHVGTVTCKVATGAGGPAPPSATAGTDYVTLPLTTVTFGPGVLSQQQSVTVNGDTTVEAANESFALNLSAPTGGAVLGRTKALGIILDDDSDRTISLSPLAVSVTEPLSGTVNATFTVSLNAETGRPLTVNYATADGSAQAGSDYTATTGTLSFAPGERTKTIDVPVLADSVVDGGETFTLTLSSPTNGTIAAGAATATATIGDSLALVPLSFYTVDPCRLVDTRNPAPGSPLVAGTPRTFQVTGSCAIPTTAKAISYNLTVAGATNPGNVRVFPGGTPAPSTSAVNFKAGQVRANNGMVALGTDGDVSVVLSPAGTTHVIIDVNGYWE
jgi:ELWxxDGT repeat protein